MLNHFKAIIQYLLPKQLLTIMFGWLAKKRLGVITTWLIKGFFKLYDVDMNEARESDPEAYSTFNEFFARQLNEDARPLAGGDNTIVMPADGVVSQFGVIENGQLIQAKGHYYNLDSLLACNSAMINQFENGLFATTYLSPKDYHRVHMPCDGKLREMIYVPGALFSVNKATTEGIPNIFARNERVICLFDTEFGPMVQILVGATIVGSIETQWHGMVTPPRDGIMKRWTYDDVELKKGEDMGCFKLGSTVITLFAAGKVEFNEDLSTDDKVKVGEALAHGI